MNRELISVILPVYKSNCSFLKRSIISILDQTYDNLEVIVIIDTSSKKQDVSIFETLDTFRDDHRIKTIVRSTKGYCSALNTGILISKGSFIARLDSDDYWASSKIQEQMELVTSSKIALVGTWSNLIDENGVKKGEIRTPISPKSIRDRIMLHNPFVHSSVLFAKHIAKKVGQYNDVFDGAEDYEFYLRIVSKGYSCANVPRLLTYLRESRDSIMRGSNWPKTRKSYCLAKWEAVSRLGYCRISDLLLTFTSFGSLLVTPKLGTHLKKATGWYNHTQIH